MHGGDVSNTTAQHGINRVHVTIAKKQAHLKEFSFKPREVPYARFAGEKDKLNVVFYESGKLVVQGRGTQEFIEFVLEPEILKQARLGYEAVLSPNLMLPRLGVDESGKGDFFGPLCIAGVYVNESVVKAWQAQGGGRSRRRGRLHSRASRI